MYAQTLKLNNITHNETYQTQPRRANTVQLRKSLLVIRLRATWRILLILLTVQRTGHNNNGRLVRKNSDSVRLRY